MAMRKPMPAERPKWFWAVWAVATVLLIVGLVRLLGGYADNIWFTLPALVLFAGAHLALKRREKKRQGTDISGKR